VSWLYPWKPEGLFEATPLMPPSTIAGAPC